MKNYSHRIEDEYIQALNKLAKENDTTRSAEIRDAIIHYLELKKYVKLDYKDIKKQTLIRKGNK